MLFLSCRQYKERSAPERSAALFCSDYASRQFCDSIGSANLSLRRMNHDQILWEE